jgi:hypothetical protein
LGVNVWRIHADGSIEHMTSADAGGINVPIAEVSTPRVSVASLGAGGFVTPVRDVGGSFKLIRWHYNDDDNVITRQDSASPDISPVGAISICTLGRELVLSAVENQGKNLALCAHACPEDEGGIHARGSVTAGGIAAVEVCRLGNELAVTAVRGTANVKMILWRLTPNGNNIVRVDDASTNEQCSKMALHHIGRSQCATALVDASGNLKLIAWRLLGPAQVQPFDDELRPMIAKSITRHQNTGAQNNLAAEGTLCDHE